MKCLLPFFIVLFGLTSLFPACTQHDDEKTVEVSSKHFTHHDTLSHHMVVDGIRSEFHVMSLSNMNLKDPKGATHHIIVKLFHDKTNHQIKEAMGKIKIIGPDRHEQIAELKNYDGTFAANFTFSITGEYKMICLVNIDNKTQIFKFWYQH